jgi:hypothetical protein
MPTDCTGHAGGGRTRGSPEAGWEHRLATRGARIEHLEGRSKDFRMPSIAQTLVENEKVGGLRRCTEPEHMARELSRDARRRGL